MKKGKPPRRKCPHLGLTVVRQAGSSVLLGTGLCEQKQWGVPGEMVGALGLECRMSWCLATAGGPVCVAERRTKGSGLKGTLSGSWMALPKRNASGQSFSVSLRHRERNPGCQGLSS